MTCHAHQTSTNIFKLEKGEGNL